MSTPEDIARESSSHGQFAAAITDHGTMGGVLKFQHACDKYSVKPIFGVEAYFVPDVNDDSMEKKAERFHLILLAKNNEGLAKLFKAGKKAWTDNFYYKPRIDFPLLSSLVDNDVVALSGCRGSAIAKALENGNESRAAELSEEFIRIFGDDFYFEVQPWNPKEINDGIIDLANSYNKKVVGTADCHYPTKADAGCEEVLLTVSQYPSFNAEARRHATEHGHCAHDRSLTVTEKLNTMYPNRFLRFDDIKPYVSSSDEISEWFTEAGYGDSSLITNTVEVAEKCTSRIKSGGALIPKFIKSIDSDEYLSELAHFAMSGKGLKSEEYLDRLNEELGIIKQLKFSDYFLIIWDLIKWADAQSIGRGPGRGSVGGSLLAYVLDITEVDPLKYDLLFARFINPERNDYPDIDLDFEDKRRSEVKSYLIERWGSDKVAAISTYGEFKAKSVIKDVSRAFALPYADINTITPLFETLDELKSTTKGRVFCDRYPDIIKVSERLEGRIRNTGIHAAGMVVSSIPLSDVSPLETRKDVGGDGRAMVSAFDMTDAESVGLIKIDILGLKTSAVVSDCLKEVKKRTGKDVKKESLLLNDEKVYDSFNRGETTGVFQADAGAYRALIGKMGVSNFNDLVVSNALVRPGAMLSQGETFINCKKGIERPKYMHELAEPILKETFGTVIFQEQLMRIAVEIAGFTWSEADILRKIIGKKRDIKEFDKLKEKFLSNDKMDRATSEKVWKDFEMSSLYMFNKSHSVAYSMLSYQTMWLRINHPLEFMWSMLANESNKEKITGYILEAQRMGIEILPPCVNISEEYFTIDNDCIRFGLSNVASCGDKSIAEIKSKRPFASFDEFSQKCKKGAVNKTVTSNLDKVGAFTALNHMSDYDHKKYYLPILGFPIQHEFDDIFTDVVETCTSFDIADPDMHIVRGVVKSAKKWPGNMRLELEDETGGLSLFADKECEISSRDYVYALVGDKGLHMHCDAFDHEGTELYDFVKLMNSGLEHYNSNMYSHGLGPFSDERTLMYCFDFRAFPTKKGDTMANMYCWDGRELSKIVIFPKLYRSFASILSKGQWYAAKLEAISDRRDRLGRLDGYKLSNSNSMMTLDSYIERKRINVNN
jgi:DNA polymerase-3 subunit alpha